MDAIFIGSFCIRKVYCCFVHCVKLLDRQISIYCSRLFLKIRSMLEELVPSSLHRS